MDNINKKFSSFVDDIHPSREEKQILNQILLEKSYSVNNKINNKIKNKNKIL